jgi:hypothetical protein
MAHLHCVFRVVVISKYQQPGEKNIDKQIN